MLSCRFSTILLALMLMAQWGCGEDSKKEENSVVEDKAEAKAEDGACEEGDCDQEAVAKPREQCKAPAGVNNAPTSIAEFTTLVNAAPKPLDVPCLLDMLARPLNITGTTSRLSVQPADSDKSPRIFIEKDGLYISVVPAGDGRKAVELSEITSLGMSVKADFVFPVKKELAEDHGYDRIYRADKGGTTCVGCHGVETAYPDFGPKAFESKAFKPMGSQILDLIDLTKLYKGCKGTRTDRCDVINALFEGGEVTEHSWPASISSMF